MKIRGLILLTAALVVSACGGEKASNQTASTAAPEHTYTMKGTLVSRDAGAKTVNIDNEDVPNVMPPMKMDYELRGAKVETLPPDGTKITSTLHERDGEYWVTDVKAAQ